MPRALEDFRRGMGHREQLSIRIGRRNTQLTDMSGCMNSMEREFSSAAGTICGFQETRLPVNENIAVMPGLDSSVRNMDAKLAGLNTDLHATVEQIRYLNDNVAGMASSIQAMNNQINNMNMTIGNMAESMHQLSKPMKALTF